MAKKKSKGHRLLKWIFGIIAVLFIIVAGYLLYVILSYSRIDDNQELEVGQNSSAGAMETDTTYTIYTNNLGFGAYTPDFTFFMDGGTESWAESKESVMNCTDMAAEEAQSFDPDIILYQEIDFGSTRSYHVDMRQMLEDDFSSYDSVFAVNYHSAFLFYPLTQPHGASNSGILTLSRYQVTSGLRRSLPISTSFSKFLDLDRCYSKSRISVENGKELVVYNVHASAYGGSAAIRTGQMTMLFNDMQEEYDAGNYCICGGDFNHDFTGDSVEKLNVGKDNAPDSSADWAQPLPTELLTENLVLQTDYTDGELVGTCRDAGYVYDDQDVEYILDGFITTDNVTMETLRNIPTGYAYSDHQPVVMTFHLN